MSFVAKATHAVNSFSQIMCNGMFQRSGLEKKIFRLSETFYEPFAKPILDIYDYN